MIASWSRRATLALAGAGAAALLVACGSGTVVSDLNPKRFVSFGDGFSDVGQNGYRFTVNDGTLNWTQQLASQYSLPLSAASPGGFSYAQGNARVASADTSSGTHAPSVSAQIDAFLARTSFASNEDVVVVSGGVSDLVAAVNASGISDATTQAARGAGKALADQVRRLVNAGAHHVVLTGVYNLGDTPWARAMGQQGAISDLSIAFNDALLVNIVDLGQYVMYVDSALFYNLVHGKPGNYTLDNGDDPVCTTPDATTCTASTVLSGVDYNKYLYADNLNLTPAAQRLFASDNYAEAVYYKLKRRW